MKELDPAESLAVGRHLWCLSDEYRQYRNVQLAFDEKVKQWAAGNVCEIGCGAVWRANATLIMDRAEECRIDRYYALDSNNDVLDAFTYSPVRRNVAKDGRLNLICADFRDWLPSTGLDCILSEFVLHHYPDELMAWYQRIFKILSPNGRFVHFDQAAPAPPDTSRACVDDVVDSFIRNASAWTSGDGRYRRPFMKRRAHYFRDHIEHLREDAEILVPLETHIRALERVGFSVEVQNTYRMHYALVASKT